MALRNLPLHRKLPLLTTGVLVVVMGAGLAFTGPVLLHSADERAANRLARAAREIARGVEQGANDRAARLHDAAQRPDVRSVLAEAATGGVARAFLRPTIGTALASIRNPGDTGLVIGLLDRSGLPVLADSSPEIALLRRAVADGLIRLPTDTAMAGRPDLLREVRFGPMYIAGDRARFWGTARVTDNGMTVGYLAQERRVVGSRAAVESLSELLGTEVVLYLRNADGNVFSRALGEAAVAPDVRDSTEAVRRHARDDAHFVVGEATMPGLPWVVVLEAPQTAVRASARATLVQLASGALVLTVVGGLVTWLATRRLSRPIVALRTAADAVARGVLATPVAVTSNDEVGQLATTFNAMAREVSDARRALEWQVADARRARAEAEQANRAKGDFLAVMSHELRTPLNAIGGYTQLLALGIYGTLTPQQLDALARVERNQEHLLRLITDVLNFARMTAGKIAFEFAEFPIGDAVRDLDALIVPQMREKGLTYSCDDGPADLLVRADRDRLRQILLNLLTNAIKFTPEGGAIRVTARADGEHAVVSVSDTGVGIAPERLERIFEPFVQGDRALHRPADGVGLGLTISRDLAIGMGGTLAAESVPAAGATFTLTLPRVPAGTATGGVGSQADAHVHA